MSNIEWKIAEVVHGYDNTYTDVNKEDLYTIYVQEYDTSGPEKIPCRPASNMVYHIPIVGEHVLIFRGIDQFSTADYTNNQWYYFTPYPIQSGTNNDILPTVAQPRTGDVSQPNDVIENTTGFEPKSISPLQMYEGDSIIDGRWGNSIRLSSTINGGNYSVNSPWKGNEVGDPIIILSNNRSKTADRKFTVETPNTCDSTLYLTSTQKITDYTFPTDVGSFVTGIQNYDKSQLIGNSSRIVLAAHEDSIILGAKKFIVLSVPQSEGCEIRIGSDTAANPIPKGRELESILNKLVRVIEMGVITPGGPGRPSPEAAALLSTVKDVIENLLSDQVRIKK